MKLFKKKEVVDYSKMCRECTYKPASSGNLWTDPCGFNPKDCAKTYVPRKSVFVICSVRGASEEYKRKLESYVKNLEEQGIKVHLPHRDTNQNATGLEICTQNMNAIKEADEVHIFYCSSSQGTHFDMGVAFALGKKIVIVENEAYGEGKSYPRMLNEWQSKDELKKPLN